MIKPPYCPGNRDRFIAVLRTSEGIGLPIATTAA